MALAFPFFFPAFIFEVSTADLDVSVFIVELESVVAVDLSLSELQLKKIAPESTGIAKSILMFFFIKVILVINCRRSNKVRDQKRAIFFNILQKTMPVFGFVNL